MSRFEDALQHLEIEGEATLADGWLDPDGAVSALSKSGDGALVLKLTPPSTEGAEGDFGPHPQSPSFAVFDADKKLRIAAPRGDRAESTLSHEIERVVVETVPRSWGVGATPFVKQAAEVVVVLADGARLSFSGAVADDEAGALAIVSPVARALAAHLHVPVEGGDAADDPSPGGPSIPARTAARFSLAFEGDLLVLRDHESRGPRDGAGTYRAIALGCFVPAALSLAAFAWELRAYLADPSAGVGLVLGPLALGLVLGVAAYAFFEIGRFAQRYSAESDPLAWFGDDRIVVAPWVNREGAVDVRPGGRFGTAIRTSEVTGTSLRERDALHAVVLESAHGPFDVLLTDDARAAKHFAALLERTIRAVASPEKKRTALLRAQERREKRVSEAQA